MHTNAPESLPVIPDVCQRHFIVSSAYFQNAEAEGVRVRFFNGVWFATEVSACVSV